MPTLIRLSDGKTVTVSQDGRLVARAFDEVAFKSPAFVRFSSGEDRIWINPGHVAAFESADDGDPDA